MSNNSMTSESLLILQFNANGLKNHVNELQIVLFNKRLALISITHFTKYSKIHIPGYNLLKTNHPDNTAYGVVAILIKSSILFQSLPNICQDYLQYSIHRKTIFLSLLLLSTLIPNIKSHFKKCLIFLTQ